MTKLELLTEYEVHQIAYLTMHGWVCNPNPSEYLEEGAWSKAGLTRMVKERATSCSCCSFDVEKEDFTLDEAYWAQREKEE